MIITYVAVHAHVGSFAASWKNETCELELDARHRLSGPTKIKSVDFAVVNDEIDIRAGNGFVRNTARVDAELHAWNQQWKVDLGVKSVPDSNLRRINRIDVIVSFEESKFEREVEEHFIDTASSKRNGRLSIAFKLVSPLSKVIYNFREESLENLQLSGETLS